MHTVTPLTRAKREPDNFVGAMAKRRPLPSRGERQLRRPSSHERSGGARIVTSSVDNTIATAKGKRRELFSSGEHRKPLHRPDLHHATTPPAGAGFVMTADVKLKTEA